MKRKLDASVEASEPHDFAVRFQRRSSAVLSASIASRPASVTIASAPLVGRDGGISEVIWVERERDSFCKRDWTGRNRLIRLNKTAFCSKPRYYGANATTAENDPGRDR